MPLDGGTPLKFKTIFLQTTASELKQVPEGFSGLLWGAALTTLKAMQYVGTDGDKARVRLMLEVVNLFMRRYSRE